jgi:hypothetical protein
MVYTAYTSVEPSAPPGLHYLPPSTMPAQHKTAARKKSSDVGTAGKNMSRLSTLKKTFSLGSVNHMVGILQAYPELWEHPDDKHGIKFHKICQDEAWRAKLAELGVTDLKFLKMIIVKSAKQLRGRNGGVWKPACIRTCLTSIDVLTYQLDAYNAIIQ